MSRHRTRNMRRWRRLAKPPKAALRNDRRVFLSSKHGRAWYAWKHDHLIAAEAAPYDLGVRCIAPGGGLNQRPHISRLRRAQRKLARDFFRDLFAAEEIKSPLDAMH